MENLKPHTADKAAPCLCPCICLGPKAPAPLSLEPAQGRCIATPRLAGCTTSASHAVPPPPSWPALSRRCSCNAAASPRRVRGCAAGARSGTITHACAGPLLPAASRGRLLMRPAGSGARPPHRRRRRRCIGVGAASTQARTRASDRYGWPRRGGAKGRVHKQASGATVVRPGGGGVLAPRARGTGQNKGQTAVKRPEKRFGRRECSGAAHAPIQSGWVPLLAMHARGAAAAHVPTASTGRWRPGLHSRPTGRASTGAGAHTGTHSAASSACRGAAAPQGAGPGRERSAQPGARLTDRPQAGPPPVTAGASNHSGGPGLGSGRGRSALGGARLGKLRGHRVERAAGLEPRDLGAPGGGRGRIGGRGVSSVQEVRRQTGRVQNGRFRGPVG
jgi:hypothetical protein